MSKKIKILQFTIGNIKGGVTQYVLNNWKFINRDKYQFDFATMSKKLDFEDDLIEEGCKVHYIQHYAEVDEEKFANRIEEILSEGYDVVHLHTNYWKSFLVEKIAIKMAVPKIIIHSHNTMVDLEDDIKRQEALNIHNIRKTQFSKDYGTDFWACSKVAGEWLFPKSINEKDIKIMNNAIDIKKFSYNQKSRDIYRKELGIDKFFVIGHVGRFEFQKNHEFIIDTFKCLYDKNNKIKLMLIGIGKLEKKIRDKIKAYGLQENVILMGKRNDVELLMQAMDLFILPSRFEGLPIVLIEAQAAGLKCLASTEITEEVVITTNIKRIPLNKEIWIREIENCYDYSIDNRSNIDVLIKKAGYSIEDQIKKIEKEYAK